MSTENARIAAIMTSLNLHADNPHRVTSDECVTNALKAVRQFLDMEVAFVSAFDHLVRTFTHVDTSFENPPLNPGMCIEISDGYCQKVVSGDLPELIPDTSLVPGAMEIPETTALPIRAHVSVPLVFSDGSIYGTFCCFSSKTDPSLNERDLQVMRTVANMVAFHLEGDIEASRSKVEKRNRIKDAIDSGQPLVHYQPVVDLASGRIIGAEALSRFKSDPPFPPDIWFSDADEVDLRSDLETAAIKNALSGFAPLLEQTNLHLAVNIGPILSVEGDLMEIFEGFPLDRLIVEITEHDIVNDYELLERCLEPIRQGGAKLAADDVGAGFANMRHIMKLRPDIIKLDTSITDAIASDLVQQALVAGVMEMSRHSGSTVLTEGIETNEQLDTLRTAGVHMGQGYHFAPPGSIEQLMATYHQFNAAADDLAAVA